MIQGFDYSGRDYSKIIASVVVGFLVVMGVGFLSVKQAEYEEGVREARRAHRQAHKCVTVAHRGGECAVRRVGKNSVPVSAERDVYAAYPCYSRTPYEVLEECDDGRRWVPAED